MNENKIAKMNEATKLLLTCCLTLNACKSLSPNFSNRDIKEKGYNALFFGEQLTINGIKEVIVKKDGIGLYLFLYPNGRYELIKPVLKFEKRYYLFDDTDSLERTSICRDFIDSYKSRFTNEEMTEILRRFNLGVIVHVKR